MSIHNEIGRMNSFIWWHVSLRNNQTTKTPIWWDNMSDKETAHFHRKQQEPCSHEELPWFNILMVSIDFKTGWFLPQYRSWLHQYCLMFPWAECFLIDQSWHCSWVILSTSFGSPLYHLDNGEHLLDTSGEPCIDQSLDSKTKLVHCFHHFGLLGPIPQSLLGTSHYNCSHFLLMHCICILFPPLCESVNRISKLMVYVYTYDFMLFFELF
jgi:hypothetical protein